MAFRKKSAETPNLRRKLITIVVMALVVLLTIIWLTYRDTTQPPPLSDDDFQNLSLQESVQLIANATVKGGAPGIVVLLRKEGQEFTATAGVANKVSGLKMSADMPLRLASISKVYSASVVISLAERGLIDLNARISEYLSSDIVEGLPNAKRATVRQLLLHTAGIPDYYDLRSYFLQDWSKAITLKRTLPVAKRGSAKFFAGEQFEYSNMGYVLLGEIAEVVTGESLGSLIQETIVKPLNFNHTYYNIQHPTKNGIHGYGTIMRPWADTYRLWEHSGPDAGIMATASETARFLEALTLDNGSLAHIGKTMLAETVASGQRRDQTLGLEILKGKDGTKLIGHTGDAFGYQTIAFSNPINRTTFIASINCDCSALSASLIRNLYLATKNADLGPASED